MCGFAAILATRQAAARVDAGELLKMRERMTARGPDGAGSWLAPTGHVGLAHRRLSIIDTSPAGAQPMTSADGRLRIVFNGEIYNFRQLKAQLEAAGARFQSHSDTEVILELYRRHGIDLLPRLRGMFAFALWDEDKQGMLLARDHFGIKPLYVSDDGTTIRAASQVKALMAGGAIADDPDPAGHTGFFLWGHVPEPHSLYRAIHPLPAGSWMWADIDGDRRQGCFFDLTATLADPPSSQIGLAQAMADSVHAHLEADVPVGVFLSAGLDSTTIAGLAAAQSQGPIKTVTLGIREFAGSDNDEVPLAEAVARHYGTQHTSVRITAADFIANRDAILADMDQPSVDGVNTWFVARAASHLGLKVVLSGLGGDELFGGYPSFNRIPRITAWTRPLGGIPGLGRLARHLSTPWIGRLVSPKAAGLLEYGPTTPGAYMLLRALLMPWELTRELDPDFVRAGLAALSPSSALERMTMGLGTPRQAISALESSLYMRSQLLRDSDWAGMAHGLEIRTPLVDIGLFRQVAFMLATGQDVGKLDMAATVQPPLPAVILERRKTGFNVPVSQWLGETSLRGWARHVYRAFCRQGGK